MAICASDAGGLPLVSSPTDLEALFNEVADLELDAAERYLDSACAGKPVLRAAVERLLAHDRALPGDFLLPNELRESSKVGRYRILRRLGEGGMGQVYAAYDESLDRRIALKVLPHASLASEAQALAKLAHPNVVAVHEVGVHENRSFIAMELVEGETLAEWLQAERTHEEVLRVFLQCGRGLAAAHEVGLVHRDFKPDNVMIGKDGRARVLDFGISKSEVSKDERVTANEIAGTPLYMSPEQFAGEAVTSTSDQFAFCIALYRALYGSHPFAGDDLETLKKGVLSGALRRPAREDWVSPLLFRGLARHAAARWPSMSSLLTAIEAQVPRDPELDRSSSSGARRRLGMAMSAAAVTVIAIVQLIGGFDAITLRRAVAISAFVFAVVVANVALRRRQLLTNRFGRQVSMVVLVGTATLLAHRLIALRFDLPLEAVITADLVVAGFELVLAGFLVQKAFFIGAAAVFAGAIVALAVPALALLAMAIAMVITIAGVALAWRRE